MASTPCWLAGVDWVLRGVGLAACGATCYTAFRMRGVFNSNCDTHTAKAKMPSDAYKGKVVWITGASSGMGEELAKQLAKHGAKLILSARSKNKLEELAAELGKCCEVRVLDLDLKDLYSLEGKAREALSFFGVIDVLVNNGGYSSRALGFLTPAIKTDIDMMEVNFLSAVALTKALLPSMHERKTGQIINISSLAGKFGSPLRTLYCGAKHALIGWFDALRVEEAGFGTGVSVTNICPGSVKTDIAKNAVVGDGSKLGVSDPNIDNGLDVSFVCDRILAAAYCGLPEVWIAKKPELIAVYTSQYMPHTFKEKIGKNAVPIVAGTLGQEYVKRAEEKLGRSKI